MREDIDMVTFLLKCWGSMIYLAKTHLRSIHIQIQKHVYEHEQNFTWTFSSSNISRKQREPNKVLEKDIAYM